MARKGNPISVRLDLNRSSDSSWFSEGDRSQTINPLLGFAVFLIVLLNYYSDGSLEGFLSACDVGRASPSVPFYPPGREAQPHIPEPEVAPIPRAVLVPELEHPLIPDIQRRAELQHRLSFYFIGRNEPRHLPLFLAILEKQFVLEKRVEAGLVREGFPPQIVLARRSEIRSLLFNHPTRGGAALSENTLNRYLAQGERVGTQQSVPYLRVLRAARYWV
nr:ribosomal protein L2 [Solanum melongena]WMB96749.1 hypothetical protein [Solanum melongena]